MSKEENNKIVVLGTGNVGHHLIHHLSAIGLKPVQLYSKSKESASISGVHFKVPFTNDLREIRDDADIYLIAIHDDAISQLHHFQAGKGIVAHTSGTVSRDVLSEYSDHYGVFYPLQTFKKEQKVDFSTIPILVDGVDADTTKVLTTLGNLLSRKVIHVSDEDRKHIHLAAVIANNFTNHLWHMSEQILKARSIDFDILVPLITKSANQLEQQLPSALQTGPAARSDQATIEKHLDLLKDRQDWQDLYKMLTLGILNERHSE